MEAAWEHQRAQVPVEYPRILGEAFAGAGDGVRNSTHPARARRTHPDLRPGEGFLPGVRPQATGARAARRARPARAPRPAALATNRSPRGTTRTPIAPTQVNERTPELPRENRTVSPYRRALFAVLALALIACAYVGLARYQKEKQSRHVEITMDFAGLRRDGPALARTGYNEEQFLVALRARGV